MTCLKVLIFLGAIVLASCQNQDYCNISSCNKSPHIGCNNNGSFSANCDQYQDVTKIEITADLQQLILNLHNTLRSQIASGSLANFPTANRMAQVQWDNELAYLADLNSKQCKMRHDKCRNTREIKLNQHFGENKIYVYEFQNH
jgi:hypothetical protein